MSILRNIVLAGALAFTAAGFSTAAQAAPYKALCAGGLCFNKDTQGYTSDRTYFYLTFNGTTVTHYNIIYREAGGRQIQAEIATRPGSNMSYEKSLKGTPGKQYTVSVQACSRVKVNVGPFSVSTRSSCTSWKTFTYYAV